jgi:DNA-binding transcriptional MerR regulator
MPTTTRQLAKLAAISESSVRNYTRDYSELLSPQARGDAGPRLFSDSDVQTLCTIATLRKEDVPRAEIIERLKRGDIVIDTATSPQQAATSRTEGQGEALAIQVVQSSMEARLNAIERRLDNRDRGLMLWGALWGAVAALAFGTFVLWVLWLIASG